MVRESHLDGSCRDAEHKIVAGGKCLSKLEKSPPRPCRQLPAVGLPALASTRYAKWSLLMDIPSRPPYARPPLLLVMKSVKR